MFESPGTISATLALPGLLNNDLRLEYVWVTVASAATWLGSSGLAAVCVMLDVKHRELRSESVARSFLHFLSCWFLLAINLPWWMLFLTDPKIVVKVFQVKDKRDVEHHGLVYATEQFSDWKGNGKCVRLGTQSNAVARRLSWPLPCRAAQITECSCNAALRISHLTQSYIYQLPSLVGHASERGTLPQ